MEGLSPREWCAKHRKSRNTFYSELNAGRLKAKRVGRRIFVTPESDAAWFASLPDYQPGPRNKKQRENAAAAQEAA